MKVKYRERHFLDKYRCIDTFHELKTEKYFCSGNLLYCYTDRYNVKVIAKEDIIEMN